MQTETPNNNTEEVVEQAPQPEAPAEQTAEAEPKPDEGKAPVTKKEPKGKRKRKRHPIKSLLRILIALIIIAGGIYLILFLVAYFAKYESIPAMLASMRVELDLMWQRIRG
jgi:uncharacterized protein HemX